VVNTRVARTTNRFGTIAPRIIRRAPEVDGRSRPHMSGVSSICCDQSAVAMRLRAQLASAKRTLLPRSSTTSRTTDSEYLFWIEFLFHGGEIIPPTPCTGTVTLKQFAEAFRSGMKLPA
jgi:hypothetical protein